MLYESPYVRVDAADGIATLWLAFPGTPVNALTPARLTDLDRGLSVVRADPHIEILVLRSGLPAGFCGGHDPETLAALVDDDAAQTAFALAGQRVLTRIVDADIVTVAFLEGPCLGPGLELAQACDYRIAVAGPESRIGFVDTGMPPCWGGWAKTHRRLPHAFVTGATLTAREAHRAGLVDDSFCERRAKIELRTFLDGLQRHLRKPRSGWFRDRIGASRSEALAAERVRFRSAFRDPSVISNLTLACDQIRQLRSLPAVSLPEVIGFAGCDDVAVRLAVAAALRGGRVIVAGGETSSCETAVGRVLAEAARRGWATPLEADTARTRIRLTADIGALSAAGCIFSPAVGTPLAFLEPCLPSRTVVAVPPKARDRLAAHAVRSDRYVGLEFGDDHATLTPGPSTHIVAAWLTGLGVRVRFASPAMLPVTHAAA